MGIGGWIADCLGRLELVSIQVQDRVSVGACFEWRSMDVWQSAGSHAAQMGSGDDNKKREVRIGFYVGTNMGCSLWYGLSPGGTGSGATLGYGWSGGTKEQAGHAMFIGIITVNPHEVWPVCTLPTHGIKLITLPPCTSIRYPPPSLPTWPSDVTLTPFYSKLEYNTGQTTKIHSLFFTSPRITKIIVTELVFWFFWSCFRVRVKFWLWVVLRHWIFKDRSAPGTTFLRWGFKFWIGVSSFELGF